MLTHDDDDNADRRNLCQHYWIVCNRGKYISTVENVYIQVFNRVLNNALKTQLKTRSAKLRIIK